MKTILSTFKLFLVALAFLISSNIYGQQLENIMDVQKDFYAQTKTEQLTKYLVENAEAINQENSINSKFMVKQAFSLTGFGLERVLRYSFENLALVDTVVIQQLMQTGFFEYVERVPIYETSVVPNDYNTNQWHLKKINAFGAFDRIGNTSNIVIAIVDDGLDTAHPDIHPNLWHNLKEIPGNGIDDDFNGFIDDYVGWNVYNNTNNPNTDATFQNHGTHCAGIASAATDNGLGIASMGYGAKIMIVKCGDTTYNKDPNLNNRGKVFNSDNGVEYAIKNKADIISMSFGIVGYYSITSQKIFDLADSKGIICVAAAGNDTSNSISYPAGYNHVISVASTDSNDRKSSFSTYNSTVDISAPGRGTALFHIIVMPI